MRLVCVALHMTWPRQLRLSWTALACGVNMYTHLNTHTYNHTRTRALSLSLTHTAHKHTH